MKWISISTMLLISSFALASDLYVQSYDVDVDMSQFGTNVKKQVGLPASKNSDSLPSIADRDAMFAAADLKSEVATWDDLDRDIFFRRVRRYDLAELKSYYPHISGAKLQHLQQKAREHTQ